MRKKRIKNKSPSNFNPTPILPFFYSKINEVIENSKGSSLEMIETLCINISSLINEEISKKNNEFELSQLREYVFAIIKARTKHKTPKDRIKEIIKCKK